MLSDAEIDALLLARISPRQQKAMKVIATVFQSDIDYKCTSELLWGFGDTEPDPLLNRFIERLKMLTREGRIAAFGDLSLPRYSEVCFPA